MPCFALHAFKDRRRAGEACVDLVEILGKAGVMLFGRGKVGEGGVTVLLKELEELGGVAGFGAEKKKWGLREKRVVTFFNEKFSCFSQILIHLPNDSLRALVC
jgi:hypothetical protein